MELWFDDGQIEIYEVMYPLLKKYPQIQPILAVVTSWVGKKDYMNRAQILELITSGWKVASHSTGHEDYSTLGEFDMDDMLASYEHIIDFFHVEPVAFVFPYNKFSRDQRQMALNVGYPRVRDPAILHFHCDGWYNDKGMICIKHASNPTRSNKELNDFKKILDGLRRR